MGASLRAARFTAISCTLAVNIVLTGCAAAPLGPGTAPPAGAASAAPVAARSATAVPPKTDRLAPLQAWARNSGYKPYSKEGKPFWCKDEALLGSHLARARCVSEDALADLQRQSVQSQQSLSEQERICAGGTCNNSR